MNLIEIERGTYIPARDILFIVSNFDTSSITKIKKKAKLQNSFYTLSKKGLSLVVTTKGDVFLCGSNPETIAKRALESNYKMLAVSKSYYVALVHIKILSSVDSLMVSGLKKQRNKSEGELQFVHQNEKRRSVLILDTDEIVYLSKDSVDIANSISDEKKFEEISND